MYSCKKLSFKNKESNILIKVYSKAEEEDIIFKGITRNNCNTVTIQIIDD
jgi:hypothetical protein